MYLCVSYFSFRVCFSVCFQYDLDDPERGMIFVCWATHKTKVYDLHVQYENTIITAFSLFSIHLFPLNIICFDECTLYVNTVVIFSNICMVLVTDFCFL